MFSLADLVIHISFCLYMIKLHADDVTVVKMLY